METDLLHLLELEDALAALGLGPGWFRCLVSLNGFLIHAVAAHGGEWGVERVQEVQSRARLLTLCASEPSGFVSLTLLLSVQLPTQLSIDTDQRTAPGLVPTTATRDSTLPTHEAGQHACTDTEDPVESSARLDCMSSTFCRGLTRLSTSLTLF